MWDVVVGVSSADPIDHIQGKDLRALARRAVAQGWRLEYTGKGHIRWLPPDEGRPPIYSASTPGRGRGYQNFRAALRRHGLEC
jgi:hypothetical protein